MLTGHLTEFNDPCKLNSLLGKLYKVKWVIFARQPFASPKRVIEYLGNYTHRVAIAESRLMTHGQSTVSFSYKDYADDCKVKCMTLQKAEFIRRFLMHVLPSGFMRIRHYGFLSNSSRKKGLQRCAEIFASLKQKRMECKKKQPWYERVEERTGNNPLLCKKCGNAVMVLAAVLEPVSVWGKLCFAMP